jgi:hypothetical protein
MHADRGFSQLPSINEDPHFVLVDSTGAVVFECRFNARAYSDERIRRSLPWLQRGLLDSIDPPLQLVAGDPPARQIPRPAP